MPPGTQKDCGAQRMPRIYRYVVLLYFTMSGRTAIEQLKCDQVDFLVGTIDLNLKGRAQTKKRRPVVPIATTIAWLQVRVLLPPPTSPWSPTTFQDLANSLFSALV